MISSIFVALLFCVCSTLASSHSEAFGTAKNPRTDLTDVYVFRSPSDASRGAEKDKYITTILNINPLEQSQAGPNYSPLDTNFVYTAHFDTDEDHVEDISFQFLFGQRFQPDPVRGLCVPTPQGPCQPVPLVSVGVLDATHSSLTSSEYYRVRVAKGRVNPGDHLDEGEFLTQANGNDKFDKAFTFAGRKTLGHAQDTAAARAAYDKYAATKTYHNVHVPGCAYPARVFVGARREAFSIALGKVFDLVNLPGASAPKENSLDRFSTTSLVLELHQSCVSSSATPVIGVYGSVRHLLHEGLASQAHVVGEQVSRLGNPLVNELIIGLDRKNDYNRAHPSDDGQFLSFFERPAIAAVLSLVLGGGNNIAPTHVRGDLIAVLLTGVKLLCNAPECPVPNIDLTRSIGSATQYADLLRFNTRNVPQTRAEQNPLGAAGLDALGYPNGRRLGDDVVDITLKVAMGLLCQPVPLGTLLLPVTLAEAVGVCSAADVPLSLAAILGLTDNSPINACDFQATFPYLNPPVPGDLMFDFSPASGIEFQNGNPQTCTD